MGPGESTRRTQRLGAYGVALRTGAAGSEQILLTRISPRGYPEGWWGLPGGGVDHGEPPQTAMVRELWEEAGLEVRSSHLIEVHDVHTVAPGRGDVVEDYHGVHLVYAVAVDPAAEPRVTELDGTTDLVTWVDVARAGHGRRLLPVVQHVLDGLERYR